ncbi:MAG: YedE family putative selenium transporter [Defluviitaleaceae bacterium]|nr:YedE family putative selenium transporter [Defluviitaleaceae bacterium]
MLDKLKMPLAGILFAVVSIVLFTMGNPFNVGLCVACFLRDIAGALGLHGFTSGMYARPEIMGLVLGAMIISLITREFSSKGGSAPITRFVLGACVVIGALIFLGCPTGMMLRIAGGDFNAIVGLFGFVAGILVGMFFLNKGFSLKRAYKISNSDGFALPVMSVLLLVALIFFPTLLNFSEAGFASFRAPLIVSLAAGLIMGGVGFISRLCFVAGIRDSIFFKNFAMLSAFVAFLVVLVIGNIIFGYFNLGFQNQLIAHTDGLWNFLGMALVGLGSVLLGGCPFRQLIMAGSGNTDSVATVFGMVFGGMIAHNFALASVPGQMGANAPVGFAIAAAIVLTIAVYNTFFNKPTDKGI